MGVDVERGILKMSPMENAITGMSAGIIEVVLLQPILRGAAYKT